LNKTIDILTVDGSPRGVTPKELNTYGVGGAEKYLIQLTRELNKVGYKIRIYNDPRKPGIYDGVEYLPLSNFVKTDDRDILISFRGMIGESLGANRKLHIGISTDQYTTGDYKDWYANVNKMVGISKYHRDDHIHRYGIDSLIPMDIGIDLEEYNKNFEKIPYQVIFCSVPDRGLRFLADYWDELIFKIPELNLVITGSKGLWTKGALDETGEYRLLFAGKKNVKYLGRVDRNVLTELQLQSESQIYPCNYPELFCISCAECQVAGAYPITSNVGALETTNRFGCRIEWGRDFRINFINAIQEFFTYSFNERCEVNKEVQKLARKEFGWEKIIKQWEKILNE